MCYFRTRTPKGDGNALRGRSRERPPRAFQNTNPERGRKLENVTPMYIDVESKFQNTNPERGRKLDEQGFNFHLFHDFRTRTPKGDGNETGEAA